MVDKFEKKGSAGSIQGRLKSKGLSNKLGDKEDAGGYQQDASGPPAVHVSVLSVRPDPSR
jgi:hypothetical protein